MMVVKGDSCMVWGTYERAETWSVDRYKRKAGRHGDLICVGLASAGLQVFFSLSQLSVSRSFSP